MVKQFTPPPRATEHCRHYSYSRLEGPTCALGFDLSGPGASMKCWPDTPLRSRTAVCRSREEYTKAEREAWIAWRAEAMARLDKAFHAVPAPIPMNTRGSTACPNCDGGILHYSRWRRGAAFRCETANCCEVQFNIADGADWPERGNK